MTDSNDKRYEINFFKPAPGIARDNSKVITIFIAIWLLAVFGFQFLLIGTTELTPEDSLVSFNEVWPKVEENTATVAEQQEFSKSLLMALGKNIALAEADKNVLKEALSITAAKLVPGQSKNPEAVAEALNLKRDGFDLLMIELLPFSLVEPTSTTYSRELPAVMEKYCSHPRGPLTDFTFLGFPFHYWYTAQFLLILFVALCMLYTIKIEKLYVKNNFVEEND